MSKHAISLENVTRKYGRLVALDGVTLSVAAGERLALLGHNGAGKTTLIKLVLGLIRPQEGEISILGQSPAATSVRPKLAYLPENVAFHKLLTGSEQLKLFARLKGASIKVVPGLLERVGLGEAQHRRVGHYSKGMRQRLGLAQILIGEPRIVVLDEPTSGLDPLSRGMFYEIVSELSDAGAAIILSSHALTEVEARTDRIVILRRGKTVVEGRLSDLRARSNLPIRVHVRARPGAADAIAGKFEGKRLNGASVEILCTPADKIRRLSEVTALGAMVEDIDVIPPSLEDIYRYFGNEADSGRGAGT
jgi:Cu-processing system ATP-binding protein